MTSDAAPAGDPRRLLADVRGLIGGGVLLLGSAGFAPAQRPRSR
ncbi:hypothetical protein ACFO1B_01740 [Dactylosporangium siamense]|nr:hypothetical protein [Dactylosporangium siamense]